MSRSRATPAPTVSWHAFSADSCPASPIIDAVETTDLGGGIDIWVPKQDTYENGRMPFALSRTPGKKSGFIPVHFQPDAS